MYHVIGFNKDDINPMGFVLFRLLKFFKILSLFPNRFKHIKDQFYLYTDSMKLAFVSYKTFGSSLV